MSLWRMVGRALWRDARAGELRLLFVAVLLGVAALSAVGFLADRIEGGLQRDARQLLGGDAVLVTSPREGSVTAVSVHYGDTVMPGATLMVVADMSRLQLETTDVDEFVVTRLYREQAVTVAIPALEVTGLAGIVRSVGMQPVPSATGEHYPVVIDLADPPEHLMIGMAARISVMDRR